MIYAQPGIRSGKWDAQNFLGFWDTNGSSNLGQTTRPINSQQQQQKKCRILDFVAQADHWVKQKEDKKKDKYLDLVGELKKTMEHESDGDINCSWDARYSH